MKQKLLVSVASAEPGIIVLVVIIFYQLLGWLYLIAHRFIVRLLKLLSKIQQIRNGME